MRSLLSFAWMLIPAIAAPTLAARGPELILWKPIEAAVLRIDDRPPKLWNVYRPDKKDLVLIQLGSRFLMLDPRAKLVYELDPAKLKRKGDNLIWNEADKPHDPMPSGDWLIREVGPLRRIVVKLSGEGRVIDLQLPLSPDQRSRTY